VPQGLLVTWTVQVPITAKELPGRSYMQYVSTGLLEGTLWEGKYGEIYARIGWTLGLYSAPMKICFPGTYILFIKQKFVVV
jgi:hypothetical protein